MKAEFCRAGKPMGKKNLTQIRQFMLASGSKHAKLSRALERVFQSHRKFNSPFAVSAPVYGGVV